MGQKEPSVAELRTQLEEAQKRNGELKKSLARKLGLPGKAGSGIWEIAEYLPAMIAHIDPHEKFVQVNTSYARWFGLEPENFIGVHVERILSSAEYERMRDYLQRAIQGEFVEVDEERTSANGIRNKFKMLYVPRQHGGGVFVVVFCGHERVGTDTGAAFCWQHVVEQASWGLAVSSPDGHFIQDANPAYARMHGYDVDEMKGKRIKELYPDDGVEILERMRGESLKQGKSSFSTFHKHRDGTVFPVRIDLTSVRDESGEFLYNIANVRDVSERRKFQEQLAKSEERLRKVVSSMPILLDAFDDQGMIMVWNRECERVTGYSADEMIGNPHALEFLYPDEEYRAWVLSSVHDEDFQGVEFSLCAKDGTSKIIAWSKLSKSNPVPGWAAWAIGVDVTEQRRFQHALLRSEERYRGMFENLQSGVAVFDAINGGENFVIKEFNPAAERINLRSREEVLGKKVTEAFPGIVELGLFDVFQEVYKTGKHRRHAGSKYEDARISYWAENNVYRLSSGEVVAVHDDISQRKKMENDLFSAKERAEAASLAKNEFLATMSHEIRTPLNGAMGMLQLALTTGLTDEQSEYISIALESSRKLTAILGDILDLSRIESGKLEISKEQFEFSSLVESVASIFERTALQKGLNFVVEISDKIAPFLLGDEGRVRQILFNLVGNAVKFTEKGEISLRAHCLSWGSERERVLFVVSDTGIGISDDKIVRIFDIFTQGEGSHTRKYGGVGLGLGIVRRLVRLMNGSLCMDSTDGVGTTAYLVLDFDVTTPRTRKGFSPPVLTSKERAGCCWWRTTASTGMPCSACWRKKVMLCNAHKTGVRQWKVPRMASSTLSSWIFRCRKWTDWKRPAGFAISRDPFQRSPLLH